MTPNSGVAGSVQAERHDMLARAAPPVQSIWARSVVLAIWPFGPTCERLAEQLRWRTIHASRHRLPRPDPSGTTLCYGDNTMIQYYDGAGLFRVGR